jgi:hypothetical protein
MFWITPVEIKSLQDTPDALLYPTGNKRIIYLGIVAEHNIIIKNLYAASIWHLLSPLCCVLI